MPLITHLFAINSDRKHVNANATLLQNDLKKLFPTTADNRKILFSSQNFCNESATSQSNKLNAQKASNIEIGYGNNREQ